MKTWIKTTLLSAALALTLTACSKEKEKSAADQGELARIEANKNMEASELTNAGEQLVTPYTWMLADKVFEMALAKNPMDKKAQAYRALLKPLMVYRGLAVRVKPFARQYGSIQKLEDSIQKLPKSPLRDFLLDGKEDISNAKQIQDLLVLQREAFNDLRKFLKANTDMEIALNLNPYVWEEAIKEKQKDSCKIIENSSSDVIVDCNYQDIAQTKIGSADVVATAQMAAGYVVFFDVYTSYSIEGMETILKQLENPSLTTAQRQNLLESVPTIGKLRKDSNLGRILDMGSDLAAATKWAMKYQDRLCPKGSENKQNRPGYAIDKGLCIENMDEVTRDLGLLEQGLKGVISLKKKDNTDTEVETKMNYRNFLAQPAQDLRRLAPSAYCTDSGTPSALRDPTLNGLYPMGDAARFTLEKCR